MLNLKELNFVSASKASLVPTSIIAAPKNIEKIIVYTIILGGVTANSAFLEDANAGNVIVEPVYFPANSMTQLWGRWEVGAGMPLFWTIAGATLTKIHIGYQVSNA